MKSPFEASGFQIEITKDGSPTLTGATGESMHHSGGAAAETWYIYGSVIEKALKFLPDARICTVGLGLGYIEMTAALLTENPNMDSYEIVPQLVAEFQKWIRSENSDATTIYDLAFTKLNSKGVASDAIKQRLTKIRFHGDIHAVESKKWNVICFDAFSKKTSGELWTPEFLDQFFKNFAGGDCVVTTYACTGNLSKALKQNGFILKDRPGFSGKRESTLAVRGAFERIE